MICINLMRRVYVIRRTNQHQDEIGGRGIISPNKERNSMGLGPLKGGNQFNDLAKKASKMVSEI